jgi:hypothetical protein
MYKILSKTGVRIFFCPSRNWQQQKPLHNFNCSELVQKIIVTVFHICTNNQILLIGFILRKVGSSDIICVVFLYFLRGKNWHFEV